MTRKQAIRRQKDEKEWRIGYIGIERVQYRNILLTLHLTLVGRASNYNTLLNLALNVAQIDTGGNVGVVRWLKALDFYGMPSMKEFAETCNTFPKSIK
jgi:hypothetical protein